MNVKKKNAKYLKKYMRHKKKANCKLQMLEAHQILEEYFILHLHTRASTTIDTTNGIVALNNIRQYLVRSKPGKSTCKIVL